MFAACHNCVAVLRWRHVGPTADAKGAEAPTCAEARCGEKFSHSACSFSAHAGARAPDPSLNGTGGGAALGKQHHPTLTNLPGSAARPDRHGDGNSAVIDKCRSEIVIDDVEDPEPISRPEIQRRRHPAVNTDQVASKHVPCVAYFWLTLHL